jgi:hypothetical protein
MRVWSMELEIPIPAQSGNPNAPDLSYVRRAWWDAINDVYLSSQGDGCPLRIAVVMRLMHGSNLILAPQNENKWTAAIGVVSIPEVGEAPWARFLQNLTDKWTSLGGNVRPHLAKQWQELAFEGKSARDYVRDVAFKTQFEIPDPRNHDWSAARMDVGQSAFTLLQRAMGLPYFQHDESVATNAECWHSDEGASDSDLERTPAASSV